MNLCIECLRFSALFCASSSSVLRLSSPEEERRAAEATPGAAEAKEDTMELSRELPSVPRKK